MSSRKRLSDATVATALKAIESAMFSASGVPLDQGAGAQLAAINEMQALFDARRELSAMATPTQPRTAGRPKGSKNAEARQAIESKKTQAIIDSVLG